MWIFFGHFPYFCLLLQAGVQWHRRKGEDLQQETTSLSPCLSDSGPEPATNLLPKKKKKKAISLQDIMKKTFHLNKRLFLRGWNSGKTVARKVKQNKKKKETKAGCPDRHSDGKIAHQWSPVLRVRHNPLNTPLEYQHPPLYKWMCRVSGVSSGLADQ